nr:penicillin-binding protein 2 [Jannaschia sp. Os4]
MLRRRPAALDDPFRPVPGAAPAGAPRDGDADRRRAGRRLQFTAACFCVAFGAVAFKMAAIAATGPAEARVGVVDTGITSDRADIVDRRGNVLATNVMTTALYAQPHLMLDPVAAADGLKGIFPDLDQEAWERRFSSARKFVWIKGNISPEQRQAVHDLGEPGLLFAEREMRVYPNGPLAAHVLGGARFGEQDVRAAEIVGVAGTEGFFDERLAGAPDAPLRLSLDLTVQNTVERVLHSGMQLMDAKGAAAVLMDIRTGELIALASLPDFDPNARPRPATEGDPADSPLFNRAVQGLYELGSTFKIFPAAQALELGLMNRSTMIDLASPLPKGGTHIRDFHYLGRERSLEDVIVESSNIGTARVAMQIGSKRQREFLGALGLMEPTGVELTEARGARPQSPPPNRWSDPYVMTISFGHGLAASPLHLASAYASLLGDGRRVTPTLVARDQAPQLGPEIVSARTAAESRWMLRQVVARGTASLARIPGYRVGGKTGTADKPKHTGGYWDDRVVTTFASVLPADDPKYVLVVTLDEPNDRTGPKVRRTAGWTAVPVAAEIIRRTMPLLGLRPDEGPEDIGLYSLARR